MANFYLRTESIKLEEILSLSVLDRNDEVIISSLKSPEPCLIEGSRGTGKSFLMRVAELQLDNGNFDVLPVYVTFSISSLINSSDPLQFYHWMLAKTLRALLRKMRKSGLVVSRYATNLLSNDSEETSLGVDKQLKVIVQRFEKSYKNDCNIDIEDLPDIEEV